MNNATELIEKSKRLRARSEELRREPQQLSFPQLERPRPLSIEEQFAQKGWTVKVERPRK